MLKNVDDEREKIYLEDRKKNEKKKTILIKTRKRNIVEITFYSVSMMYPLLLAKCEVKLREDRVISSRC